MHGPASIVPEPIEEFADEPGGTPVSVPQITSRPTLERIPLPALEPDLPLIPRTVPLAERTAADPTACRAPADLLSESATNRGPDAAPGVSGDGHARLRGGVRVARGDALSARRRDRDGGSGSSGVRDGGIACLRRPQPQRRTRLRPHRSDRRICRRQTSRLRPCRSQSRPLSRPDAQCVRPKCERRELPSRRRSAWTCKSRRKRPGPHLTRRNRTSSPQPGQPQRPQ